jgi:glyoxylase-like metal-dependent hydrolase (beta-lactamase superfamily II)
MHTDHAGGLSHFPHTEIIVTRQEYQAAKSFGGKLAGYLPQHWPNWFAPRQIDFSPEAFVTFPAHLPLTKAGDVILVPTPGHSAGHMSVILREEQWSIFFAGDTSYTQQLMLDGKLDGVSPNDRLAHRTLQHIQSYTRATPTVYLPSHDPASAKRLEARETIIHGVPPEQQSMKL